MITTLRVLCGLALIVAISTRISGQAPNPMLVQSDKPTESIWSCPVHAVVAEQNHALDQLA